MTKRVAVVLEYVSWAALVRHLVITSFGFACVSMNPGLHQLALFWVGQFAEKASSAWMSWGLMCLSPTRIEKCFLRVVLVCESEEVKISSVSLKAFTIS